MEKHILTAIACLFLVMGLTHCTMSREAVSGDTLLTQSNHPNKQIAVLLPLHGEYGAAGKRIRAGILSANKGDIRFYDAANRTPIINLYNEAVQSGADFVIGPLTKKSVDELAQANTLTVPVLALNYSETNQTHDHFYEFGLSPENEAEQIAERAANDGFRHAIVIAPNDAFGSRLVSSFNKRWYQLGGQVTDTWRYSNRQSQFSQEVASLLHVDTQQDKKLMQSDNDAEVLRGQRRQDVDVIFLFAKEREAHLIVPLLNYYYADNIPVYAASSVYAGIPNPESDKDLNGVTVCDMPWRIQMARSGESDRLNYDKLYAVGRDAYLISQILDSMGSTPVLGATGELTLGSNHKIYQRLMCAKITHGRI